MFWMVLRNIFFLLIKFVFIFQIHVITVVVVGDYNHYLIF